MRHGTRCGWSTFGLGLLLALAPACREPTVFQDENVAVRRVNSGYSVTNKTDLGLAYVAADRDVLPLLDLFPCADPGPECLRLPPRGSVHVPFDDVIGYDGSGEVVFSFWTVTPDGAGGYRTQMVATITAKS